MAKKESKLMQRLHRKVLSLMGVAICFALFFSFATAHEGLHEQIVAITARIKRDPKNANLYLQRGELYRLHREWTRAAADYDRVARLQPGLTVVDLARGKMLWESRKPQQAKVVLDRFLRQQPDHLEGLITRARVLAGMRSRIQAAQDFTKALSLTTNPDPELYLERARVLAEDRDSVGEALRGLDEGISKHGPLVTLQLSAIELELRRKNYDAALTRLDTISAQSERQEMWFVRRGEILQSAGRNEEARAAFRAALVAIESLPPGRRQSRTVTALEHRAREGLRM
jgi:predicted Zn-dependent protease